MHSQEEIIMKQLCALLLAVLMLATVFTGCAQKAPQTEQPAQNTETAQTPAEPTDAPAEPAEEPAEEPVEEEAPAEE